MEEARLSHEPQSLSDVCPIQHLACDPDQLLTFIPLSTTSLPKVDLACILFCSVIAPVRSAADCRSSIGTANTRFS